jgi:competence protein ComEA
MKAKLLFIIMSFFIFHCSIHADNITNKTISKPNQEKIDLNQADAKQLKNSVRGIGIKRAEAIVKYRQSHSKFSNIHDLSKVPGIGEKFIKSHNAELEERFVVR